MPEPNSLRKRVCINEARLKAILDVQQHR